MSLPKSEVSEILNVFGNVLIRLVDRVENNREFKPFERRELLNTMYEKLCGIQIDEILKRKQENRHLVLKRGNNEKNSEYIGTSGEITMDTDTKTVRVHDGETAGGVALARATDTIGDWVVESQLPTAENNYTWYRKYKSGWVEQGQGLLSTNNVTVVTHELPIEMINNNYTVVITSNMNSSGTGSYAVGVDSITTTSFTTRGWGVGNSKVNTFSWYVCGMTV